MEVAASTRFYFLIRGKNAATIGLSVRCNAGALGVHAQAVSTLHLSAYSEIAHNISPGLLFHRDSTF